MAKASGIVFPISLGFGPEKEVDDYRAVPATDRGNASYGDRGGFGSFSPSREPYRNPSDVNFEAGYGVTAADLERGWCEPTIREDPAYDLANYKQRYSDPLAPDEDNGNRQTMDDDWEFRERNRRSKGFLTRPRVPTER